MVEVQTHVHKHGGHGQCDIEAVETAVTARQRWAGRQFFWRGVAHMCPPGHVSRPGTLTYSWCLSGTCPGRLPDHDPALSVRPPAKPPSTHCGTRLGFTTGILRVQFSDTVPLPVNTVTVAGEGMTPYMFGYGAIPKNIKFLHYPLSRQPQDRRRRRARPAAALT